MTFQESDLIFDFSDQDWNIIQYDTHRYYKILSGVGLKGVDFLGIYQKKQVVFFEVKHYRSPLAESTFFQLDADFNARIVGKLADSIKAIRVIHQYLERKWWYRFYQRFAPYIPTSLIKNKDWYFWYRLFKIIQQKDQMQFVLWLEADGKSLKMNNLEQDLLDLVEIFTLANLKNPAFKETLQVTSRQG